MSDSESTQLLRPVTPALDEMLGRRINILDDGFIRVVDYMGNDTSIVQAARVSYGVGTKQVQSDAALIRYLLRHRHTTPFEMCEIKFHVRTPMDVWRQWIRHRTASVNEYSTRYSVAIDSTHVTAPDSWRRQSQLNRQGSEALLPIEIGASLSTRERELHDLSKLIYAERLQQDVAREQARKDLPLSTYTEAYWKIDLHNLMHFLALRLDRHAQYEIRQFAAAIADVVAVWVPTAWSAFKDYAINATVFSIRETQVLRAHLAGDVTKARELASSYGWLNRTTSGLLQNNRERLEFAVKAAQVLGIEIAWLNSDYDGNSTS